MQNCFGGRDPRIFKRKFPLSAGGLGAAGRREGGGEGREWGAEEGRGDQAAGEDKRKEGFAGFLKRRSEGRWLV